MTSSPPNHFFIRIKFRGKQFLYERGTGVFFHHPCSLFHTTAGCCLVQTLGIILLSSPLHEIQTDTHTHTHPHTHTHTHTHTHSKPRLKLKKKHKKRYLSYLPYFLEFQTQYAFWFSSLRTIKFSGNVILTRINKFSPLSPS